MLYRVEIRKKDGSVKYYGLKKGNVFVETTSSGGFKTAHEVFRCVEAELREDPTADYALSFAALKEKGFLHVCDPDHSGQIAPILSQNSNLSVIIYCEDSTVDHSADFKTRNLAFDQDAFAAAWEIARNTPRTPIWKSLLLNPSTWYMSATLAIVIATLISFFNPEAFVQALPYLAIAAPVFAGVGVLMLVISTIYAIVSEVTAKNPGEPNPVVNYLRERAEWIRHNPVKSGLILGIGSAVLLAAIILTVGYFTQGFGIFPVDSFEFMHVVFDGITKLFAAGISYLSVLTGLGVMIPEASITSFALTASAVAFVTSIFWTFDTTLRLAHTATDLTMPPRIKAPEAAGAEQQKLALRDPVPPPNNQGANPFNTSSPVPTAAPSAPQNNQTPAPSEPQPQKPQANAGRPQQPVVLPLQTTQPAPTHAPVKKESGKPWREPSEAPGPASNQAQQPKAEDQPKPNAKKQDKGASLTASHPDTNATPKQHRTPILTPVEKREEEKQANFALFDAFFLDEDSEEAGKKPTKAPTLDDLKPHDPQVSNQQVMLNAAARSSAMESLLKGQNKIVDSEQAQEQPEPPKIPKRKIERDQETAARDERARLIKEQLKAKQQLRDEQNARVKETQNQRSTSFWFQEPAEDQAAFQQTNDTKDPDDDGLNSLSERYGLDLGSD